MDLRPGSGLAAALGGAFEAVLGTAARDGRGTVVHTSVPGPVAAEWVRRLGPLGGSWGVWADS